MGLIDVENAMRESIRLIPESQSFRDDAFRIHRLGYAYTPDIAILLSDDEGMRSTQTRAPLGIVYFGVADKKTFHRGQFGPRTPYIMKSNQTLFPSSYNQARVRWMCGYRVNRGLDNSRDQLG